MFLGKTLIQSRLDELIGFPDRRDRKPENAQAANLDLRVGDEIYISGNPTPRRLSDAEPYVVLQPGQFALVKTLERITMPSDLVGLISIRSRYKMQGLVNISGFHVDPNFKGPLFFAVQNVGPSEIRLRYKDEVFMMMWAYVQSADDSLGPKIGPERITLEQMAQLGGATQTISSLREQIRSLEVQLRIYGGILAAAVVGILIQLLRNK
jgi:dCTP deaminase